MPPGRTWPFKCKAARFEGKFQALCANADYRSGLPSRFEGVSYYRN